MDSQVSNIHEIKAGRVDWKLRVRVTNLWTIVNKNNPLDKDKIEMLLIDEKVKPIVMYVLAKHPYIYL